MCVTSSLPDPELHQEEGTERPLPLNTQNPKVAMLGVGLVPCVNRISVPQSHVGFAEFSFNSLQSYSNMRAHMHVHTHTCAHTWGDGGDVGLNIQMNVGYRKTGSCLWKCYL